MSRFTKPTLNWVEFAKRVPPEQKAQFLMFKNKAASYLRRVQASPSKLPEIKWDEYAKLINVPGMVEEFKEQYEKYDIPYPEDTMSEKVDEQWKALEPEIKAYCKDMQKDIEEAQKELDKINALPNFEDMTLEMFYDIYNYAALDPVNRPSFWPHTPEEQPKDKSPKSATK